MLEKDGESKFNSNFEVNWIFKNDKGTICSVLKNEEDF